MSFRTVTVSSRSKLDLNMGYLEIRADEKKRIRLDEIDTLVIENNAVSVTGCLLSALVENKINVILCDGRRNPQAQLLPFYGCHNSAKRLREQIAWDESFKGVVWTAVVSEKISNQAKLLRKRGAPDRAALLEKYLDEIEYRDATNREGHAAKVYFNTLFGLDFTRDDACAVNAALNYCYSLILSCVNREVAANGCATQIGLFHDNVFNHFNLSCDLMEPFRPFADEFVSARIFEKFGTEEKHECLQLLTRQVRIDGAEYDLTNAVRIYVRSVIEALNASDITPLVFPEL